MKFYANMIHTYLHTSVVYTHTHTHTHTCTSPLPYYIVYLFWLCPNEWTQVYIHSCTVLHSAVFVCWTCLFVLPTVTACLAVVCSSLVWQKLRESKLKEEWMSSRQSRQQGHRDHTKVNTCVSAVRICI